ncbi:hypothetical protein DPMN_063522 [Dreissena polymorpha]|uniref:Uncharacterized protein n=1 Tax=Dreissena polymorpha TaxID=45954 RepID=A0A9D4HIN9_DREPO|nr:hypothetical protein DPMN_063522 [Dreissena polymorpha]
MGPVEKIHDRLGYTPLHFACYNGHEACVDLLLENEEHRKFTGNTFSPLHCAVSNGNDSCTELLLDTLGDSIVDLVDSKGRTPVHAASFRDQVESLTLLLGHRASVNKVDKLGRTPIMLAASQGHLSSVELLLQSHADLTIIDDTQNTALHYACMHGHEEVALILLDKIDDQNVINKPNNDMKTPLHIAAKQGLTPVVQDLISKGASLTVVDNKGYSPALSCAPNDRVADCLAIILAHMSFAPSMSSTFCRSTHNDNNNSTLGKEVIIQHWGL